MRKTLLSCLILTVLMAQSQITRQWVARYNGQGDFNDRYTCIAIDASGNIYLGGSTVNPDVNKDYLVIKLNSSGVVQWRKEFDWTGSGPDEVQAIMLDANSVYVTGYAKSRTTGTDYLTIKMNVANGDTIWARSYNYPPASATDQANSLFVDGSGNVYATGQSDQDSTSSGNYDYATVKYSSTGTELWVARFNNSFGNSADYAIKVVADNSGNSYVTGRSFNGTSDDYVTIKYNSSGVQQWIKYDDRGGTDRATDMVIDANSNIYITGRSNNGTDDDFWTLKYNSAGVDQWAGGVAYNFVDDDRANALTIDGAGNVYVTGQSDFDASSTRNWNYETVKYNSNGVQQWAKSYDGTVGQEDVSNAVAVDPSGNVFVTGQSDADASTAVVYDAVTVGYNSSGIQLFATVYSGAGNKNDAGKAIAATSNGCVIAGYTENSAQMKDALAVSYNLSGTKQWEQSFNGVGDNNDNVRALTVDVNNNVFAAGYTVERNTDRDMALVKFDAGGNFVCEHSFNGTSTGSTDEVAAVVLDNSENPIVAGYTKNKGESSDITYFKLNAFNCDSVWLQNYDAPAHRTDRAYDMVSDAGGNLYITGRVDANPGLVSNDNCFTAKISPAGNILWLQTYDGTAHGADRGSYIRVAPSGNVYVAGRTFNGTDDDVLLINYNNSGTQQWVQTYHGGNGNDEARWMEIDANENVYVCGNAEEATPLVYDYVVLKYNSSGVQQWVKKYNGSGNGDDEAVGLAVDYNGNVIVTGYSDVDSTTSRNRDIVTVKYDANGSQSWVKDYDGFAHESDISDAIAVNALNQIYLTGHTNKGDSLNPNYDIITFVLDQNGNQLWSDVFNGASDSSDIPAVIYLKGNDFYVAGSSVQSGQMRDMVVIKYSGIALGIKDINTQSTARVYPNPFGNFLSVSVSEDLQNVAFQLSDVTGRKVVEREISGTETLSFNNICNGFYFYTISSADEILAKGKIIHAN